ncbi:MAG: M50 family metallopeptidase [Elusimicrobiota bacterium]|nr:M50 family metallopeptidase [Elusimicrobiota bacterium]
MTALIATLWSIVAVGLTFGLVIFLHEFGHFIVARKLGVRVEKFAFGFGPELLGVTDSTGTRFSICAIPLGGFVKPAGEDPSSGVDPKPDEYFGQSWNRRLAIVAAGPAMNYVLAFTLFTGVVWLKGMPVASKEPVIGNLMVGFPADKAGIELDDRVLLFDGRALAGWEDLAQSIHRSAGKEIALTIDRKGERIVVKITPKPDETGTRGVIGIMPKADYEPVSFAAAAGEGVRQCWAQSKATVTTIAGKIWKRERPDLAGPVGIVQMVHRAAHSDWADFVFLIGFISVAIGFFNILPVPLLDGGHAVFYLWEGLVGRRPKPEVIEKVNGVGIAFLLSLLVFATYNDVLRIRNERAIQKNKPAVEKAK